MSDEAFEERRAARGLLARYLLLTAALVVPLAWAFVSIRNLYPVASWTVMMGGGDLERGRTYYVLRGETIAGETVDLPLASITNALRGRGWGLVAATVENDSLTQPRWPHPSNAALVELHGGVDRLPPAVRLPELLRALGRMHNDALPADSARRLRAVRLDEYRWDGGRYGDYDRLTRTWREQL